MSLDGAARRRALFFAFCGVALLCFMDGVIKHLVARYDALAVTFGRYIFATGFAAAIWAQAGRPVVTGEMWRAHGLRGVIISVSAVTFFWSLSVLPLAEAVAISFVAPLLIPFFARLVLGEKINPRSIAACVIGFAGVLVATLSAPQSSAHPQRALGIAAILIAAVAYALSVTLLRGRAGKDGPPIVGLLAALIPGCIIAGPALTTADLPAARDLPAFALMGAFGASGMYLLAKGYAGAQAQELAPLEYTALLWATAIGFGFFGEVPTLQVFLGAALIIGACLWGAREPAQTSAP
jgi:S-adenosylmethionine uptake transporter